MAQVPTYDRWMSDTLESSTLVGLARGAGVNWRIDEWRGNPVEPPAVDESRIVGIGWNPDGKGFGTRA